MRKPIPLHTPPAFQRYDCHQCGACCRAGFAVVTAEEERQRITAQGWHELPEFQGRKLFARLPGGKIVVAQNSDGACIFLDQNNTCRIHARFGPEGKPFACRPYPFVLLPAGKQARVSLRFDCPSVAGNQGRPLPEHRTEIQALLARALPPRLAEAEPPAFRPGLHLDWQALARIAGAFDRLLATETLDITRRMLACADLAGLLARATLADLEGPKLDDFLGVLVRALTAGVAVNPLQRRQPVGMVPPLFRQAAGLYGRLDRLIDQGGSAGQRLARLGRRLGHSLRLLGGRGTVPPVREGLPSARFADLECPFGIPGPEAAAVLTRYYRVKLDGFGFCGRAVYGWSFLEGVGALLLTFPLILWYARLFALGAGRPALDAEMVQRAVRVVDRPHGNTVALALPHERIRLRFLAEHENLSTLIVWYGT